MKHDELAFDLARHLREKTGRIKFHLPSGRRAVSNAGAPSVLVAFGKTNADALASCGLAGAFVPLREARV